MADTEITVKTKFEYKDNSTRLYTFNGVAEDVVGEVTDKIKSINSSLAAGTAGGMSSFFVSDNGNNLVSITAAQIEVTTTQYVPGIGG